MSISIIIPVLNEAERIGPCLDRLTHYANLEILVVDGGSSDATLLHVQKRGVNIIVSQPGRGQQQHAGALAAKNDLLLFLHSDTKLPDNFALEVRAILQQPNVAAGAFQLAIDNQGAGFRLVERGVNLRSRIFQMPYGDQALFMKKTTYFSAGGFPKVPIMEDVLLVHRLKKLGRILLADTSVVTSARRWQKHGILKTLIINQFMLAGRMAGISPDRLARWYYGKKD